MSCTYHLQYKAESIELYSSHANFQIEAQLMAELAKGETDTRLAEVITKSLYSKFELSCHESDVWTDNLKTLLAHGFGIRNMSTAVDLRKSYLPVEFRLYSERTKMFHPHGRFFREEGDPLGGRFVEFCRNTDYPPGIGRHILAKVLLTDGGKLVALAEEEIEVLLAKEPGREEIRADDEVFIYITDKPMLRSR